VLSTRACSGSAASPSLSRTHSAAGTDSIFRREKWLSVPESLPRLSVPESLAGRFPPPVSLVFHIRLQLTPDNRY
jgi:hypothetical protein